MTTGERLRDMRKTNHLTLLEVGRRIGVTKTTIHKYEIGEITNIPLDKLKLLGETYGCTAQYLLGLESFTPEEDTTAEQLSAAIRNLTPLEEKELLKFMKYWYPRAFNE